ncbi:arf-GAP with GTPase, ANK repeat and PH domain-containing protein 2-like [Anoplopoma fimbria]|uniref:arf-GAP with GTPase, ANK repeat and PH domain-containing protein 2-like n=1 Tax=Anoplopoma fimbria TaxID=229290 RepID=UPI0023EADACC|nr:arf-GAP with GTPase, ANK repeat and PH domain-containing protein 2-like [Anoplopoma fimbria]
MDPPPPPPPSAPAAPAAAPGGVGVRVQLPVRGGEARRAALLQAAAAAGGAPGPVAGAHGSHAWPCGTCGAKSGGGWSPSSRVSPPSCSWTEDACTRRSTWTTWAASRSCGSSGSATPRGTSPCSGGTCARAARAADSPERVQRAAAVHGGVHHRGGAAGQPALPAVPPAGGGLRAGHGAAGAGTRVPPPAAEPEEAEAPVLGHEGEPPETLPDDYLSPQDPEHPGAPRYGGPALTSLELVDYPETILPENALRSLTSLRSLTVRYRYIREGVECRLTSWLSPLHQLETLSIIGGNSLAVYTTTIPSSVTRLTLRVAITLKDMDSIAPKVPALEHLDIEQNRSSGSLCRRIPMLFPQLRTLRIRFFRREPEKDLLSLHRLRHLVQLELLVERSFILRDYLNGHPWPSPCVQELINQLRELSENRITVITTMRQRNPLRECDCVWEGD